MAQVYIIRTINGSTPPMPKSMKATQYVIDKDSYRNAKGDLIRNILTSKMKFELEFPPMTKTALQSLLTILNSDKFTVQYENLTTGTLESGDFYHNDISVSPRWIRNEANTDVLYEGFAINLIQY